MYVWYGKAGAMGINWWRADGFYSGGAGAELAARQDVKAVEHRIQELEERLTAQTRSAVETNDKTKGR